MGPGQVDVRLKMEQTEYGTIVGINLKSCQIEDGSSWYQSDDRTCLCQNEDGTSLYHIEDGQVGVSLKMWCQSEDKGKLVAI
jgi:hypothetical protein